MCLQDLGLAQAAAESCGAQIPHGSLARQIYGEMSGNVRLARAVSCAWACRLVTMPQITGLTTCLVYLRVHRGMKTKISRPRTSISKRLIAIPRLTRSKGLHGWLRKTRYEHALANLGHAPDRDADANASGGRRAKRQGLDWPCECVHVGFFNVVCATINHSASSSRHASLARVCFGALLPRRGFEEAPAARALTSPKAPR